MVNNEISCPSTLAFLPLGTANSNLCHPSSSLPSPNLPTPLFCPHFRRHADLNIGDKQPQRGSGTRLLLLLLLLGEVSQHVARDARNDAGLHEVARVSPFGQIGFARSCRAQHDDRAWDALVRDRRGQGGSGKWMKRRWCGANLNKQGNERAAKLIVQRALGSRGRGNFIESKTECRIGIALITQGDSTMVVGKHQWWSRIGG